MVDEKTKQVVGGGKEFDMKNKNKKQRSIVLLVLLCSCIFVCLCVCVHMLQPLGVGDRN